MFIELQAAYFVLRNWRQNPAATKREIGIWAQWKEGCEENDRPLSEAEVRRMKAFLHQHAPSCFPELPSETGNG
jgi:hypothetical protein